MKLSELCPPARARIIRCLDRQMACWEIGSMAWRPEKRTGTQVDKMRMWYQQFLDFRQEVLHDEPMLEAYKRWYCSHHDCEECPDCATDLLSDKINVPQYDFLENYYAAAKTNSEYLEENPERKEAPAPDEIED